mmetsp:Transcript_44651/g.74204  ORF Transcript_44651/g.74204 Transcript_44651/m.74204 type:complete len:220 (+) Transcript_44651:215-874(+)
MGAWQGKERLQRILGRALRGAARRRRPVPAPGQKAPLAGHVGRPAVRGGLRAGGQAEPGPAAQHERGLPHPEHLAAALCQEKLQTPGAVLDLRRGVPAGAHRAARVPGRPAGRALRRRGRHRQLPGGRAGVPGLDRGRAAGQLRPAGPAAGPGVGARERAALRGRPGQGDAVGGVGRGHERGPAALDGRQRPALPGRHHAVQPLRLPLPDANCSQFHRD